MSTQPVQPQLAQKHVQWQTPARINIAARPVALWPWLTESGSLTAKLRACCGSAFHVIPVSAADVSLHADEAAWVARPRAFVREVQLCGAHTSWVQARTIALDDASRQALTALGSQALGDGAFEHSATHRKALEVARIDTPSATIWGRRSVLQVETQAFYISEFFINGVPKG